MKIYNVYFDATSHDCGHMEHLASALSIEQAVELIRCDIVAGRKSYLNNRRGLPPNGKWFLGQRDSGPVDDNEYEYVIEECEI